MKNILIITTWFPNKFEPTKCIFNKKMTDALSESKSEYNYTVICPKPYIPKFLKKILPKDYIKYLELDEKEHSKNYSIYRPDYIKIPRVNLKYNWKNYYKSVKDIIDKKNIKFDIIHSHGIFPDSYVAIKIGELLKIPVVCHFHDSYFNKIYSKYKKYIKEIMIKAKRIVAVSEFQKNKILEFEPNFNNIEVVYNGVDIDQFNLEKTIKNKERFIFIGNLIKTKGLDVLLSAFSKIENKNIKLDIYGKGNNLKEYIELSKKLNISKRVFFKGIVKNEELPNILNKYSGLILPSRYETFGIVLIEAMACGVFVIGSDVGGISEIITSDDIGYLFEKENVEELKNKIELAYKKKWNRVEINKKAQKFSNEILVKNIERIYLDILKEG